MVDDWFKTFYTEHLARHRLVGLAPLSSDVGVAEFKAMRTNLIHRGVSDYDVATKASELLVGEVLPHSSQHVPRLIELAVGLYKARAAAMPQAGGGDPMKDAQRASLGCEHCGGSGLAPVYHPNPCSEDRTPASCASHCVCPMGRWVRGRVRETARDVFDRIPDLRDVLDGERSGRLGWVTTRPDLVVKTAAVLPRPPVPEPPAVRPAFASAKALKCLAGFLLLRPQPETEVSAMARSEGLDMSDVGSAAMALEVSKFKENGIMMWRCT